jgi:hypothetical protein
MKRKFYTFSHLYKLIGRIQSEQNPYNRIGINFNLKKSFQYIKYRMSDHYEISSSDRLNLKKLISESDATDNTEYMRRVKHSIPLAKDIQILEKLKSQNSVLRESSPEKFHEICQQHCSFLYNNYTDIFNRLLKDELNLLIMQQFLQVLKMIEDGRVDQHEGSVIVGKILKELYLDSAVRRGENLDKEHPPAPKAENKSVSWSEYKSGTQGMQDLHVQP